MHPLQRIRISLILAVGMMAIFIGAGWVRHSNHRDDLTKQCSRRLDVDPLGSAVPAMAPQRNRPTALPKGTPAGVVDRRGTSDGRRLTIIDNLRHTYPYAVGRPPRSQRVRSTFRRI
jgi:hypothetical protein